MQTAMGLYRPSCDQSIPWLSKVGGGEGVHRWWNSQFVLANFPTFDFAWVPMEGADGVDSLEQNVPWVKISKLW